MRRIMANLLISPRSRSVRGRAKGLGRGRNSGGFAVPRLNELCDDAKGDLVRMIGPDLDSDRAVKCALRVNRQPGLGDVATQDVGLRLAADDAEVRELAGAEDF